MAAFSNAGGVCLESVTFHGVITLAKHTTVPTTVAAAIRITIMCLRRGATMLLVGWLFLFDTEASSGESNSFFVTGSAEVRWTVFDPAASATALKYGPTTARDMVPPGFKR